jgi:hypothetical protein
MVRRIASYILEARGANDWQTVALVRRRGTAVMRFSSGMSAILAPISSGKVFSKYSFADAEHASERLVELGLDPLFDGCAGSKAPSGGCHLRRALRDSEEDVLGLHGCRSVRASCSSLPGDLRQR